MMVLYHIPYLQGLGADRWIFEGWRNALADMGHIVIPVADADDVRRWCGGARVPNVLMTSYSLWNLPHEALVLALVRQRGCRVAMFVDNAFLTDPARVARARQGELADLFFGERSEEMMAPFVAATQRPYVCIPNAADRSVHTPAAPDAAFACDIAFVGAYLPKKRAQFRRLILPLVKRYRVRIYGPYWTWKDMLLVTANKWCRWWRWYRWADAINNRRLLLSPAHERLLYASAKISLNLHERDAAGRDFGLVNQRAFKIPACGGFEICDFVPTLRQYFAPDEAVMARDEADWYAQIAYYLTHEREREHIRQKGTARVQRDHTYHHRVRRLLELVG